VSSSENNISNFLAAIIFWAVLGEFLYSYLISANPLSLTVIADRFIDAFSITMVFVVNNIAIKPPSKRYSYGFHRVESLMNIGVIVLFIGIALFSLYSSTIQLFTGWSSSSYSTFFASIISIPLIILATLLLRSGKESNFHVLFLHSIQDLVIVILALTLSFVSFRFHYSLIDYLGNYAVIAVLIYGNRKIFTRTVKILMEGSPDNITKIEKAIEREFPMAHHLHVWDICEHQRVATLHLSFPKTSKLYETDLVRNRVEQRLRSFGITHVTIQIESDEVSD